MRIYVDQNKRTQDVMEWAYKNQDDTTELVIDGGDSTVTITDESGIEEFLVYVSDIPNLILALQAAYDELRKQGE